jgi:hypothetical protein
MTDIKVLKKFASEVIELAQSAQDMAKRAVEAHQMQKQASAKAPEVKPLNSEKLEKAASAVASLYADRSSVDAQTLGRVWSADHNTLVDSLLKVASDRIAEKVKEPSMVVVKKASSKVNSKPARGLSHVDAFDQIFGIGK